MCKYLKYTTDLIAEDNGFIPILNVLIDSDSQGILNHPHV